MPAPVTAPPPAPLNRNTAPSWKRPPGTSPEPYIPGLWGKGALGGDGPTQSCLLPRLTGSRNDRQPIHGHKEGQGLLNMYSKMPNRICEQKNAKED